MASMSSGMANGTSKPDYMNSFMSFLETQDGGRTGTKQEPKNIPEAEEEQSEENLEKAAADENPLEKDVTPTDHAPDDHPPDDPLKIGLSPKYQGTCNEIDNPDDPEPITYNDPEPNTYSDPDDPDPTYNDPDDPPEAPEEDIKSCIVMDPETSSEGTTGSETEDGQPSHRNVARRGRKKSPGIDVTTGGDSPNSEGAPQRESLRRASRRSRVVQRYGQPDQESDVGGGDSDPDFHLSDSDDDPDFNPLKRSSNMSDDDEVRPRRGRGRGRGVGGYRGRGRGVKRTLDSSSTNRNKANTVTSNPPKRRGRPPSYHPTVLLVQNTTGPGATAGDGGGDVGGGSAVSGGDSGGQDNTVTSTDEKKTSSKLTSAYNYAGGRVQRQSHTIKLPEGPQLTSEQLAMVESQFKVGEFVMAKKDMDMMEHPPIWRIDGKSLLQKFQAFEKDGKTLYRNISTYSGWTPQAKALYIGVRVTFVFQSRYDTVVELVGIKDGEEEDKEKPKDTQEPTWAPVKKQQDFQISDDLRSHMPSFEIYLQTLISQALDNNFLMEIYAENDDYFVERVKVIDELAEQRKMKVLEIVEWNDRFKNSLDTWPCINVMLTSNADKCQACGKQSANKLSQLYGQPYNQQTLRSREPVPSELDAKNFEVCDRCSNLSQMYNKVTHQKYDYYSQCKSTVTNMRVTHPSKHTTTILRDLLANDHWIMGLFRSMCTTWIKVDRLHCEHTQSKDKGDT